MFVQWQCPMSIPMRFYGRDVGYFYELKKSNAHSENKKCIIENALKILPEKQEVGKITTLNWVK